MKTVGRIGRISELRARLGGISRPTIDRLEASDPDFPKRIQLGPGSVGWDLDAVDRWLESRPRGPRPLQHHR